jgi:uncharacterized protein (TIGR00725 family)
MVNNANFLILLFFYVFMYPVIGVIGGSSCQEDVCDIAYKVGKLIAKNNCVLASGGLGGVMLYASKGAKDAGGLTIGILPYGKEDANPYVDIAIPTYYGLARNHLLVRCADVLIAIDGYIGTLSEISFALNEGKTVIALNSWKLEEDKITKGKYLKANTPEEAVKLALKEIR